MKKLIINATISSLAFLAGLIIADKFITNSDTSIISYICMLSIFFIGSMLMDVLEIKFSKRKDKNKLS